MVNGGIAASLILFISVGITQLCWANLDNHERTYDHILDNGQKVACNLCRPGFHWQDHCTVKGDDTKCTPCEEGSFSAVYNRWKYCAQCGKECDSREYVTTNCTSVSNISCKCQEGYYRESGPYGICREISPCPPGKGVVTPGNESANTQCRECAEGYFSPISSTTEACEKCSVCLPEMVTYRQCKPNADTVCRSQNDDPTDTITIIGIVVGVVIMAGVIFTILCCFCFMKERCASIRKKLYRCCHRPYQECTQTDQTSNSKYTAPDDVRVDMPPDLIRNTKNGTVGNGVYKEENGVCVANGTTSHSHYQEQKSGIDKNIFNKLIEDLISPEYPQFFRFLFTKDADRHIDEMKMNHNPHGVKEIIYQILARWIDVEKEGATPEKILDALKEWKRMDLHKKYSNIFEHSAVQMDNLKENKLTTVV